MRTAIKTKYVSVEFHEDHDGDKPFYWVGVSMAWAEKDSPMAKAFSLLMDNKLRDRARILLKDAVEDPVRDIYLEDLLVNLKAEAKHLAAPIIGLVESLETEFDALVASGRNA